jgi:hypothetical protein
MRSGPSLPTGRSVRQRLRPTDVGQDSHRCSHQAVPQEMSYERRPIVWLLRCPRRFRAKPTAGRWDADRARRSSRTLPTAFHESACAYLPLGRPLVRSASPGSNRYPSHRQGAGLLHPTSEPPAEEQPGLGVGVAEDLDRLGVHPVLVLVRQVVSDVASLVQGASLDRRLGAETSRTPAGSAVLRRTTQRPSSNIP